jgi:hypothetical protein
MKGGQVMAARRGNQPADLAWESRLANHLLLQLDRCYP